MATKVLTKIGPFCSAPMRVLTAAKEADDDDNDLHTVCVGTPAAPHPAVRVRQKYKCPSQGCSVEHSSYHPFPRGRENADKTFTVLTTEELDGVGVDQDVKDTLTLFRCAKGEVDERAIPNGKFYYLGVGDGPGRENYAVIRDTIRDDAGEWTYMTVWAYRSAPCLVKIVLVGDVLGIQQVAWPAQVQQLPNVEVPAYDERWLALAKQAAEVITVEFDPATFMDVRKTKVAEMLAAAESVEGGEDGASTPVATSPDAALADLAAWVEAKKNVGGVKDTGKTATPKKRAPRKTAAVKKTA